MSKKILLMVMVMLCTVQLFGQAPGWEWARSAGGSGNDKGTSIASDANGNLYVAGLYESSTITFGNTTLINSNPGSFFPDIFIVKYDTYGNVIWAKGVGSTNFDFVFSIAIDANGNALIAGSFLGPSISFDTTILSNSGGEDIFIAKYDSSGTLLWAHSAGVSNSNEGLSVTIDANGNSLMTGYFSSTFITFGGFTLLNTDTSSVSEDIFIVKYDVAGNVLWAKDEGGLADDYANSITTDVYGNIYITGNFASDSLIIDTATLINAGGNSPDVFVIKYDSAGNNIWAKRAGGTDEEKGISLTTDFKGNLYLTGYFWSTAITFGSVSLNNSGHNDIFIVKYDSLGNVIWAKSATGMSYDYANSITTDASGNIYITGTFSFFSLSFGTTTLTNTGNEDIFVAKYDETGNVKWAISVVGLFSDYSYGIAVDLNGNSFITGGFNSPVFTFGSTMLNSGGSTIDFFVAKLDSSFVTGISEQSTPSNPITLYPNPTTSQLNITSVSIIDKIEITDVIGQVIYSAIPHDKSCSTELKQQGIYFVSVTSNNQRVTKKVVVQW